MNKNLLMFGLLVSSQCFAAAQVNYLNVDGDVVHFSTAEAKSASAPQCAVAETSERYAVSLDTKAGRAMYSLLITAMASKQAVTVKSAGDCVGVQGIERALGVIIAPQMSTVTAENSHQDTILDNLREFSHSYLSFFHSGSTVYSSDETIYFSEQFSQLGGNYTVVNTAGRKSLANVQGSGWLTSVLTAAITADDIPIKLEVIIDGVNYTYDLLSSNRERWLLGDTQYTADNNGYRHLEMARPHDVISKGRAVYFKTSLEVWVTMGQSPRSIGLEYYAGVNYILGGKKLSIVVQ